MVLPGAVSSPDSDAHTINGVPADSDSTSQKVPAKMSDFAFRMDFMDASPVLYGCRTDPAETGSRNPMIAAAGGSALCR
jgi:hypothetical protein